MEKETSTFNQNLDELWQNNAAGNIADTFAAVSDLVYNTFGVNIWFVEILGRRWSHIAGRVSPSFTPPEHIQLSGGYGVVADAWQDIPEQQREQLVNWLEKFLNEKEPEA